MVGILITRNCILSLHQLVQFPKAYLRLLKLHNWARIKNATPSLTTVYFCLAPIPGLIAQQSPSLFPQSPAFNAQQSSLFHPQSPNVGPFQSPVLNAFQSPNLHALQSPTLTSLPENSPPTTFKSEVLARQNAIQPLSVPSPISLSLASPNFLDLSDNSNQPPSFTNQSEKNFGTNAGISLRTHQLHQNLYRQIQSAKSLKIHKRIQLVILWTKKPCTGFWNSSNLWQWQ